MKVLGLIFLLVSLGSFSSFANEPVDYSEVNKGGRVSASDEDSATNECYDCQKHVTQSQDTLMGSNTNVDTVRQVLGDALGPDAVKPAGGAKGTK